MTDTLTIARDLEASGIDRGQAEAIASAIGKSDPANPSLERVATKGDIDILRSEMRRAFGVLFALILALNGLTLARLFGAF